MQNYLRRGRYTSILKVEKDVRPNLQPPICKSKHPLGVCQPYISITQYGKKIFVALGTGTKHALFPLETIHAGRMFYETSIGR